MHIIRGEGPLRAIRRYIRNNPIKWAMDRDNPNHLRGLPPPETSADYLADIPGLSDHEPAR